MKTYKVYFLNVTKLDFCYVDALDELGIYASVFKRYNTFNIKKIVEAKFV